jgi:hypothetical protein
MGKRTSEQAPMYLKTWQAIVDSPHLLVLILLPTLLYVLFWIRVVTVFRLVHAVGRIRAVLIGIIGFSVYHIWGATIESPAVQLFLRSFLRTMG